MRRIARADGSQAFYQSCSPRAGNWWKTLFCLYQVWAWELGQAASRSVSRNYNPLLGPRFASELGNLNGTFVVHYHDDHGSLLHVCKSNVVSSPSPKHTYINLTLRPLKLHMSTVSDILSLLQRACRALSTKASSSRRLRRACRRVLRQCVRV